MPSNTPFSFPKHEHLCSQRLIDALFSQGHRLAVFPFAVRWMLVPAGQLPTEVNLQVLIVAPKRKFPHAVDRNRVKRITRECYRKQKLLLVDFLDVRNLSLVFSVSYVHTSILSYETLYSKMEKVMASLKDNIQETLPANT